ncbi:MAG TPA: DUF1080 domain-containing protein [Gemmataceae bacterium]|jgi:hypothetical protein|nr:DUF1080 domain-containing protein [Gemmataceae bacterium]
MRSVLLALLAIGLAVSTASAADPASFFDGKSLAGWEGLPQHWKVVDGAIVGSTMPDGISFNTFLCSTRKYKDFEMTFQVRLKGAGANSGVQIRSEVIDKEKFVVKGPQADMGAMYWGSLYGEKLPGGMMKASPPDKVRALLKPDDFNDYSIKCVGKHVTIKLNGETMVDGDFPQMTDEGIIAFQLHATRPRGMEATFRKIEFKEIK